MPELKFDRVQLDQLLRDGKKKSEIAKIFGVSPGAITHACKELRAGVCTAVALEAGHKIAANHLDAVAQLQEINTKANQILNGLMLEINPPPDAEGKAQPKQPGAKDLREIALKAMAEIRGQLNLQLDIMKTLYNVTAIADFQSAVLQAIGESNKCHSCGAPVVCAKCGAELNPRGVIVENLKRARALRAGVQFRP
jgi:hypothetical protein